MNKYSAKRVPQRRESAEAGGATAARFQLACGPVRLDNQVAPAGTGLPYADRLPGGPPGGGATPGGLALQRVGGAAAGVVRGGGTGGAAKPHGPAAGADDPRRGRGGQRPWLGQPAGD